jgi:glucose-6-phosphate 1-epimerase
MPAALPSSIRLAEGGGGLPCVDITTPLATARVYFHGAHVAAWHPAHGAQPVLWLSSQSLFQRDKPIRGGVPICFPWFGPHASQPNLPAHGFARLAEWALTDAQESSEAVVALTFTLSDKEMSTPAWPHPFLVVYRVIIGPQLTMELEVRNTGDTAFTFEEALHTYFAVENIEHVTIAGLESTNYLDKTAGFSRRTQGDEPVRFTAETDRSYLDTSAPCVIHDPGLNRRIIVSKRNSQSTVVWNPWIDKSRAMADFGDDEWRGMVCVETANIGDASVRLEPGASHTMTAEITVEALP